MNGKKYLYLLFTIGICFFIILIFIFYALHDQYNDDSLNSKAYLIKNYQPKIIIGGDSRAERQFNPILAQNLLGMNNGDVVNIAISSGDPLMIETLISKYPQIFRKATLIISISENELNDGSQKVGYFSNTMISKMDFFTQIQTFQGKHLDTLLKYYRYNIINILKKIIGYNKETEDFTDTFGFNPIHSKFDINKYTLHDVDINPWYENYQNRKLIKINLLRNSLYNIKSKVNRLYIYNAPLSPKFVQTIINTNYYNIETDMQKSLETICQDLNISYKSYAFDKRFENKHFYDAVHLNDFGADYFTTMILQDMKLLH